MVWPLNTIRTLSSGTAMYSGNSTLGAPKPSIARLRSMSAICSSEMVGYSGVLMTAPSHQQPEQLQTRPYRVGRSRRSQQPQGASCPGWAGKGEALLPLEPGAGR
uniref:Uncharacterized protein n=1 Tax=Tanacetum cinerariifolium TaxID=118510 RepID=A0A699VE02_TANCI|nr:hypothetical protein [Tanacetum cinerariifolium]